MMWLGGTDYVQLRSEAKLEGSQERGELLNRSMHGGRLLNPGVGKARTSELGKGRFI